MSFMVLISTVVVGMEKKKSFYEINVDKDIAGVVDDFKSRFQIHKKVTMRDIKIGVTVYEKQSKIKRDVSIIVFCSDFYRDENYDRILFDKKRSLDGNVKIFFDKKKIEDAIEFFGRIKGYVSPKGDSKKTRKIRITFVEIAPFSIIGDWISSLKELIKTNYPGMKPGISSHLLQDVIEFVEKKKSSEIEEFGLIDPVRIAISGGCCSDVVRELSDLITLHLILELDPEPRQTILYNDQYVLGIKSSHIVSFKRVKKELKEGKNGEVNEITAGNKKVLYDGPNAMRSGVGKNFVSFKATTEYFVKGNAQIFPKDLISEVFPELRKQGFFDAFEGTN